MKHTKKTLFKMIAICLYSDGQNRKTTKNSA